MVADLIGHGVLVLLLIFAVAAVICGQRGRWRGPDAWVAIVAIGVRVAVNAWISNGGRF